MGNERIVIGLTFGLIVLSIFVVGNLCQGHDVAIDTAYSGAINGVKITYDSLDITDDPAYLVIGEEYKLKSKIKNVGNFSEAHVDYMLLIKAQNGSVIEKFTHFTSSLKKDESKYMPTSGWDNWNTIGLPVGTYALIANISINPTECDYSDNERKRIVMLDYDYDSDGVVNILDKCPNSMLGEEVDENGCDAFQFCEPFYCSLDCFYADWKGNEGKYPHDCTMVIVLREGTYEPKCVPLSCGD